MEENLEKRWEGRGGEGGREVRGGRKEGKVE